MAEATAIVPHGGVRPGYNATGSTITAGYVVKKTAGSVEDNVALANDGDSAMGVAMADIANLTRGDVQIFGQARCVAGAAVARGAEVTQDNSGKVITAVSNDYILGIARSAAGADGDIIEVELAGPSSGRIKA